MQLDYIYLGCRTNGVMTLYWYTHWFWITIVLAIYGVQIDRINATTTHSTTIMSTETHRSGKSIGLFTVIPPTSTPAKSIQDNTRQQSTKQISVIESNVTTSLIDSLTYINATENTTVPVNSTEETIARNESSLTTSERVGTENLNINSNLSAAGITGITLGCITLVGIISAISFFIYRNRGFNRPQVLSDRSSNLDSSGYIDDTSVRDNSEEMYSLDNDSFLNSLEAMTIQNYWTDTVKHTKL